MEEIQSTKKQFTYRGKTVEELKQLDVREFAKYAPARQKRTILRQFQEIENFINRAKEKITKNKQIRTHLRGMIVTPQLVGMKIQIHSGNKFVPVEITGEMLGHVFGEFAPTRGRIKHGSAGVGATKGSKSKSKK